MIFLKKNIICILFFSILISSCSDNNDVKKNNDIKNFNIFLSEHFSDKVPKHKAVFVELNGDNTKEVLLFLTDFGWCGTGGCNLLVLQSVEDSYKVLTEMTVSDLPIRISNKKSFGWNNLIVYSNKQGNALLRFNGKTYPKNPSMEPLASSKELSSARVVMKYDRVR